MTRCESCGSFFNGRGSNNLCLRCFLKVLEHFPFLKHLLYSSDELFDLYFTTYYDEPVDKIRKMIIAEIL